MACVAEFGIIENFDRDKDYSDYEPEKYKCIGIDDDILDDWWGELILMKTYFHSYDRQDFALSRYGVTLIPPESLDMFSNIVLDDIRYKDSTDLLELGKLIENAIERDKYIIHYGI